MTDSMLQTPCAKLGIPRVKYANGEDSVRRGHKDDYDWIFFERSFVKRDPRKEFRGFVLSAPDLKGSEVPVERYMNDLRWILQKGPNDICKLSWVVKQTPTALDDASMDAGLQEATRLRANFAVLILQKKNIPAHSAFKNLTDRKYGVHSLCLTETPNWIETSPSADGDVTPGQLKKSLPQYLINVSMKMNLKANGINHEVQDLNAIFRNTLVLCVDVTHPSPGCIVGSPLLLL